MNMLIYIFSTILILNNRYAYFRRNIMLQNKLPKGYYIVCIIFILTVLINFSYVDGNAQILIDFGPYHAYVSDVGLALCKAYIYTISIYGLINNTSWGLIRTTLIAFLIGILIVLFYNINIAN